jgi:hypothetical protein
MLMLELRLTGHDDYYFCRPIDEFSSRALLSTPNYRGRQHG